ncbi:MAG TPA: outer membrane beta-barrel protein [Gemmatimonadaceae bacterium]
MNRLILTTLTAVTLTATSATANAQFSSNPFQIGASAGIAFPLGDLGNFTNTGYNVTFAVGYKPMLLPIGIRAEAAYNQFGLQGGGGNVNIPAFTGNLVYELPAMGFTPYAIGGAGLYRTNVDQTGLGSSGQNRFGFNVGGGVKIPLSTSFETFVEARYNHVTLDNGSFAFVPVTVGIMF